MIVHFSEVERNKIVELAQQSLWNEVTDDVAEALRYYREERGLSDDVIKRFRFGYYPQRLKKAGHDWAGRLIMPLYDQHDNLTVLTSRDFRCKDKSGMPHLHEEFDKKFYLFGLPAAKPSIIRWQKAIVVEGQFDTCYSHVRGFDVTVGILGSAFSMHHVSVLARYCSEIFLVFDADDSGYKNLTRSMKMYKSYGLQSFGIVFVPVLLPKHKDPDEFLHKESKSEYTKILAEAKAQTLELGTIGYYESLAKANPTLLKSLND
jgi:DNA primase